MGASRFVGRVGGLAVALGVGAAVFAGIAAADAGDSGSDQPTRTGPAAEASDSAAAAPARAGRSAVAGRSLARSAEPSRGARDAAVPAPSASVGRVHLAPSMHTAFGVRIADQSPAASVVSDARPVEGADSAPVDSASVDIEPVAAEADSVTVPLTPTAYSVSDAAGTDPLLPADSPLSWALLSFARREPLTASTSVTAPMALVATAEQTNNGVTVAPTTELVNGVVQGALNATSERGLPMTYKFIGGSVGGKMDIGNVPVSPTLKDPQSYTILPYANWLDAGGMKGAQQFNVRVSEVTDLDAFLTGIPLIGGLLFSPVISMLQQAPLLSTLLAPIIGGSIVAAINVAVNQLAPADTPVAYTYDVVSFDGVKISTNFFPAAGLAAGEDAPTVLNPPGLGSAGQTNPYMKTSSQSSVPSPADIRGAGYNLITWDPRGEFASGGVLQLDNPFFEGRDTSAIISWAASNTPAELNGFDDPAVGMVGGSYGGGIQMTTVDPRIDAIVPAIAWNSLNEALYPSDVFKSAWATVLLLSLVGPGARINTQIYEGMATGLLFNWLSRTSQAVLASSGPTALLSKTAAPTMLVQGTVDALFPLNQAVANAEAILANPYGTPVKMTWFCGGHGYCLDPVNPAQTGRIVSDTIAWLDTYVAGAGDPAKDIPVFQWYDQKGVYHTSDLLPFQKGFNQATPFTANGTGGTLGIIPLIGGSGALSGPQYPSTITSWPVAQTFATNAVNALNVAVNPTVGDQIVGAPSLSFAYTGLGTGKAVFAQLVDNATGRVVGNNSTPVPVTLDGREHIVKVPMQDIAYTVGAGDSLTLQIVAYSTLYSNTSIGLINVSDIRLDLPVRAVPTVV